MKCKPYTSAYDHRVQARKRCEEMERDAEDAALEGRQTQAVLVSGPTFVKTSMATHFMLWPAIYFTYALSESLPSLTLKLISCVLVPVRLPVRVVLPS